MLVINRMDVDLACLAKLFCIYIYAQNRIQVDVDIMLAMNRMDVDMVYST